MEKDHGLAPPIPILAVCQKLTKQTVGVLGKLCFLGASFLFRWPPTLLSVCSFSLWHSSSFGLDWLEPI